MQESPRPDLRRLQAGIEQVVKGKTHHVQLALVALLAEGHLLIEDVPGVGKTTLAHMIARLIESGFNRIQFTSDLLPSDILGVTIFNQDNHTFEFKPGPIFTNIVLADEINRTTPKTQSCLLEAMAQSQVTIDGVCHELPEPFFVLATQNPVEFHGTFPLPKSQVDRFMMRLTLGYPDREDELTILREQKAAVDFNAYGPVLRGDEIVAMQREVTGVRIDESLLSYIHALVDATRRAPDIELGISTRGALALRRAAQAHAYFFGRDFVVPDDIKAVAVAVMAHRLQLLETFDAGLTQSRRREDEEVVRRLLQEIEVPA